MEEILNEPVIKNFLSTIHPKDRLHTLKELVLIGVNMVSEDIHASRGPENCCHDSNHGCHYRDILTQIHTLK